MRHKPLTDEEIAEAADRAEGKKPEPEAKRGRPAKYQPSFAEQAAQRCAMGATNADLADFFGVAISTVKLWAVQHEEFSAALKVGKEQADQQVERSLYQRAVGYTFDSEKVMAVKGEVVRVPIREHVAPDVTAQIFWLKNRQPERWREKQQVEISGTVKTGLDPELLRNLTDEQREQLRSIASAIAEESKGDAEGS